MSAAHPQYCSFCGKSENEVFHIVEGPTVFICDECIKLSQDIIDEKMAAQGRVVEHNPEGNT